MGKLGTSGNPIKIRVNNEMRMEEVLGICKKNNWKFICVIEADYPEDISELEYMLNPKSFGGKRPKMKHILASQHCPVRSGQLSEARSEQ